MLKHNKC